MERHPGVFIAATNLMRDIDAAALRRFMWKLEFLALAPEQAWHMFCTEAGIDPAGGDPAHLEELAARLGAIENLTPGDFATVKRQANMLAQRLSPEDWLEQLSVEAKQRCSDCSKTSPGSHERLGQGTEPIWRVSYGRPDGQAKLGHGPRHH